MEFYKVILYSDLQNDRTNVSILSMGSGKTREPNFTDISAVVVYETCLISMMTKYLRKHFTCYHRNKLRDFLYHISFQYLKTPLLFPPPSLSYAQTLSGIYPNSSF